MKALLDTDVLLDYLNGEEKAAVELKRFGGRSIRVVAGMEVMVGADPALARATEQHERLAGRRSRRAHAHRAAIGAALTIGPFLPAVLWVLLARRDPTCSPRLN